MYLFIFCFIFSILSAGASMAAPPPYTQSAADLLETDDFLKACSARAHRRLASLPVEIRPRERAVFPIDAPPIGSPRRAPFRPTPKQLDAILEAALLDVEATMEMEALTQNATFSFAAATTAPITKREIRVAAAINGLGWEGGFTT